MWQGVPIDAYFLWTVSDNWEWSDGYCPKFGLVDVDRGDGLRRRPRPSYHLWTKVGGVGGWGGWRGWGCGGLGCWGFGGGVEVLGVGR